MKTGNLLLLTSVLFITLGISQGVSQKVYLLDKAKTENLEKLYAGAEKRKFYLAENNVFQTPSSYDYNSFKNKKKRIFGLEDYLQTAVNETLTSWIILYRGANNMVKLDYRDKHKEQLITSFGFNPVSTAAWELVPRPFPNKEEEELATYIDDYITKNTSDDLKKPANRTITGFTNLPVSRYNYSFVQVARAYTKAFRSLVLEKYADHETLPDLELFHKGISNPEDTSIDQSFVDAYRNNWRMDAIVNNIIKVHENALLEKRDVKGCA